MTVDYGTLSLVFSPERRFSSPLMLKLLVFCNVNFSFVSGALILISLERFELVAHLIEYINELSMAVVDCLIVLTILRVENPVSGILGSDAASPSHRSSWSSSCLVVGSLLLAIGVPIIQLCLYLSSLPWAGEKAAHFLEFAFEAVTAAISFWFCIDNMLLADRLKLEIMLAPDEMAVVIDGRSTHAAVHDSERGEYSPPKVARFATK